VKHVSDLGLQQVKQQCACNCKARATAQGVTPDEIDEASRNL